MKKLASVAIVLLMSVPVAALSDEPRNEAECVVALSDALKTECLKIYANAGEASTRDQCLNAIAQQVELVCGQFFGEGADFCATCTKSCTDNFERGSDSRKECLRMCLSNQAC